MPRNIFNCWFRNNLDVANDWPEYQQIVAELDRLGFMSHYYTIEIGCLGHYLKETVSSMKKVSNLSFSKTRALLDKAAAVAITSSQRIFLHAVILPGHFKFCS